MQLLLKEHGCRNIVISAGSRNAPLIISFTNDADYQCFSAPDERSAAFIALGMTLENRELVAVISSSGSAVANFYPAVCEAFYQKLPLVILTADRPKELIDQGIGQAIRQENIFDNHIVKSANLLREPQDDLAKNYNQRIINEAMLATQNGPVHINVPLDEPLYETTENQSDARFIGELQGDLIFSPEKLERRAEVWNESAKIWVLAGQLRPNEKLEKSLSQLNEKSPFLIFSETLSNLQCDCNIATVDRLINTISDDEKKALQPDLVISIGGEVVSKMVKKFLRNFPPKAHWYLDEGAEFQDTYGALTEHVRVNPTLFFEALSQKAESKNADYRDEFLEKNSARSKKHDEFLAQADYSDLVVFEQILKHLPKGNILHCANSTPIRYSQLFDHQKDTLHFANRGTSGIDGCTSTALGHALSTEKEVVLITGDIAFLYDSNAFWIDQKPDNLKVIVINNGGGNIFRIIEGPDKSEKMERFQETVHELNLEGVASIYQLPYSKLENPKDFNTVLPWFFNEKKLHILEIKTPRKTSPQVLKKYFEYLKNG